MITTILLSMVLHGPPQIHDTRDITVDAPRFDNSPRFRLHRGMRGDNPVDRPRERRRRQGKNQEKLDRILIEMYGDESKIIRFRGHLLLIKRGSDG